MPKKVYSAAEKKAFAIKMAKARANATVSGRGAYRKNKPAYSRKVRGYGSYATDFQKKGAEWGGKFGSAVGNLSDIAYDLSKIAGYGAYAVQKNSLYSGATLNEGNDPPEIVNAKDGRFVIRHREYIQDVTSPGTGFNVVSFKINPGIQDTFPWLATLGQSFEQYRMRGMIFEYKSTYSEYNGTTPALGTVIMATEYDVTRSNFTSKIQMENHQYASSCKPSLSMIHPIECARSASVLGELYVRSGEYNVVQDPRISDFGNFQIATNAVQAGVIGELWCTYEIELLKPILDSTGNLLLSSYYENTTAVSSGVPFGTLSFLQASASNEISCYFDTAIAGKVWLPETLGAGTYLISITWAGTVAQVCSAATFNANSGCSFSAAYSPWTIPNMSAPGAGETSTRKHDCAIIQIDGGVRASFTVTPGIVPTGINAVYFAITSWDSSVVRNLVAYAPPQAFVALDEMEKKATQSITLRENDYFFGVTPSNSDTEESTEKPIEKSTDISLAPDFKTLFEGRKPTKEEILMYLQYKAANK